MPKWTESAAPFVRVLKVGHVGKGPAPPVPTPSWNDVQGAVAGFETGSVGRVELANEAETVIMTIHGAPGVYHVGISEMESRYHFFWNGEDPQEERLVEVGWNVFPAHQLCHDPARLLAIVRAFYEMGRPLDTESWLTEEIAA